MRAVSILSANSKNKYTYLQKANKCISPMSKYSFNTSFQLRAPLQDGIFGNNEGVASRPSSFQFIMCFSGAVMAVR